KSQIKGAFHTVLIRRESARKCGLCCNQVPLPGKKNAAIELRDRGLPCVGGNLRCLGGLFDGLIEVALSCLDPCQPDITLRAFALSYIVGLIEMLCRVVIVAMSNRLNARLDFAVSIRIRRLTRKSRQREDQQQAKATPSPGVKTGTEAFNHDDFRTDSSGPSG